MIPLSFNGHMPFMNSVPPGSKLHPHQHSLFSSTPTLHSVPAPLRPQRMLSFQDTYGSNSGLLRSRSRNMSAFSATNHSSSQESRKAWRNFLRDSAERASRLRQWFRSKSDKFLRKYRRAVAPLSGGSPPNTSTSSITHSPSSEDPRHGLRLRTCVLRHHSRDSFVPGSSSQVDSTCHRLERRRARCRSALVTMKPVVTLEMISEECEDCLLHSDPTLAVADRQSPISHPSGSDSPNPTHTNTVNKHHRRSKSLTSRTKRVCCPISHPDPSVMVANCAGESSPSHDFQ